MYKVTNMLASSSINTEGQPSFAHIMSGMRPYHDLHNEHIVLLHIVPGGRPSRSETNQSLVSDRLWEFLNLTWSHKPTLRPDMSRVVSALQSLKCVNHPHTLAIGFIDVLYSSGEPDSEKPDDCGTEVRFRCFEITEFHVAF
jgi:hypothetical protein